MLTKRQRSVAPYFAALENGDRAQGHMRQNMQRAVVDEYLAVAQSARELLLPFASCPYEGIFAKPFFDLGQHEGVGILILAAQLGNAFSTAADSVHSAQALGGPPTAAVSTNDGGDDAKIEMQTQTGNQGSKKNFDPGTTSTPFLTKPQDDIHYQAANLMENLLGFISTQLVICTLTLAVALPLFVHGVNGVYDPDAIALNGKTSEEVVIVKTSSGRGGTSASSSTSAAASSGGAAEEENKGSNEWFSWQASSSGFLFAAHIVETAFLTMSMWNSVRGLMHGFFLYSGVALYMPELHQKYKLLVSVITKPCECFIHAAQSIFFLCAALPFLSTRISPISTVTALLLFCSAFYTVNFNLMGFAHDMGFQQWERCRHILGLHTDELKQGQGSSELADQVVVETSKDGFFSKGLRKWGTMIA
ncbi:unnamed protein product [Amoebophrya sp. A120]|nr:unnamed protein product [Amoebophrya sp. A120]|eukprot:GSA120T00012820001.1